MGILSDFSSDGDGEAGKSRELTLALLAWSPEPMNRSTFTPGHVTCTGCVWHPTGDRILLVHHKRLGRWLLPGGHVDAEDVAIADTARREVLEETGVRVGGATELVNVDVHPIPPGKGEPLHLHHDLIFAFRATSEETTCSEESRAVEWCALDEFDRYNLPIPIRRAIERSRPR